MLRFFFPDQLRDVAAVVLSACFAVVSPHATPLLHCFFPPPQSGANAEVLDNQARTALDVCSSAKAFDLLRARAEIYNRRERLAGVLLKRDLIASTEDGPNRAATIARAAELQREVRGLEAAKEVVQRRVDVAQADILHYKLRGKLEHDSGDLERAATLKGRELLEQCLDKKKLALN